MALIARYLADKSALARMQSPTVQARLGPLITDGLVASCALVDLEVLYSSRSLADYEATLSERAGFEAVPVDAEVMTMAIELQHALACVGQHRVPIPDLIISAAAAKSGLVVLHYDADFARLFDVGGADHEWVVPRGSV